MFKNLFSHIESIIAWLQRKLSAKQFILLSAVLVGVSSALAVILLKSFAHSIFEFTTYITGDVLSLQYEYIKLVLPIIGILLTVFVVKNFLGGSIEKGTSQILHSVAKKSSFIPKKQMYSQIVTSSLTVGLGGSAGLESPIVITGAAYGSNYAKRFHLNYRERTLLVGCGVAAGIATAFNAPIAGVLFAVEVLLVEISIAAFTPIMISAATGALISAILLNENILLHFTEQEIFNWHNTLYYIALGLCTGLLSVFYSRNFTRIEHYISTLNLGLYKKALVGASILAVMIFLFPPLYGEGYESIKALSESKPEVLLDNTIFKDFNDNSIVFLIFIGCAMMLKAFASGITLGSGGNGGNFAPSLFLGSYAGFFFSSVINHTGFTSLPVSNFAIVGMSGILSGLFHAPLTAIFLIAEITGGYELMVPLMIVSSVSYALSKQLEKHAIDVKLLALKGHAFTEDKDKNILSTLKSYSVIKRNFATVMPNENLEHIFGLILNTEQVIFAVVNEDKKLLGIVHFNDIKKIIMDAERREKTLIKQVMKRTDGCICVGDNMEMIMNKLETSKDDFIPVIKNEKYYGFISKVSALEAYRSKLKSMMFE